MIATIESIIQCDIFNDSYLGFKSQVCVSVFDHWLTEEQAESSNVMSYNIALESGSLSEYEIGEKSFIQFYRGLKGYVYVKQESDIIRTHVNSELFLSVLIGSLREKKLMDVFFETLQIRVVGGYDRTDLILMKGDNLERLKKVAGASGLFILDTDLHDPLEPPPSD